MGNQNAEFYKTHMCGKMYKKMFFFLNLYRLSGIMPQNYIHPMKIASKSKETFASTFVYLSGVF